MALDLNNKVAGGNNAANAGAVTEYTSSFPFSESTEAAAFDGTSTSYLAVNTYSGIEDTGDQTFECWINLAGDPSGTYFVFSKGDVFTSTGQHRIGVYSSGGDLFAQFGASDGANIDYHNVNLGTFSQDTWYHIAWIWTASSHKLEATLNGVSKGTDTSGTITTINADSSDLQIGTSIYNSSRTSYFIGRLDDIRIWSNARAVSDILANYNKELTGTETNLVAYFPFETSLGGAAVSEVGYSYFM